MWLLRLLFSAVIIITAVGLSELIKRKLPKRVCNYIHVVLWVGLMLWLAYEGYGFAAWLQFGFLEVLLCFDIYLTIRKKRLKEEWEKRERQLTRNKAARHRARWILDYKVTPEIRQTWLRQDLASFCCDCEHFCPDKGTCGRCMPFSPLCKKLRGEPVKGNHDNS